MNTLLRNTLAAAGLALATQTFAQVTFYEHDGYQGRTFTTSNQVNNFERIGFNDRASSVVVSNNQWEVCEDEQFNGRCMVLRPGRYSSLGAMGLNDRISSVRKVSANSRNDDNRYGDNRGYAPAPATAQITFYENENFQGRSFTTNNQVGNFERYGFNDRASSVMVFGDRFEVCDDQRYNGRCAVLRPGRYASLYSMGLNERISSVRPIAWNARVDDNRYSPAPLAVYDARHDDPRYATPVTVYDNRQRNQERLYEANVTSVHAVLASSGQRCWIEQEQVTSDRGNANVGGAIAGALIGGILGHQVGGGRGKDVATAGGAVVGAVVGSNVGRDGGQTTTRDVQRCSNTPSQAHAEYWDVSYNFRGQEHRIQMTAPPGSTVTVNELGEPRA